MTFRRTTCPHCRGKLEPSQRIHPACINDFADAQESKAKRTAQKQARAAAKVERADIKRRKDAVKSRGDLQREAQTAVNAFVRLRDANLPCVSCGRYHAGQYHAGHYRSVGSAPHLRFDVERNLQKQCQPCNTHLHGNLVLYRQELIRRIGLAAVEALESDQAPRHYSIADLREIKTTYAAKARQLLKAQS